MPCSRTSLSCGQTFRQLLYCISCVVSYVCVCVCFYPPYCIQVPCRAGNLECEDTTRWGPAGLSASSASSCGLCHTWHCYTPTRGTSLSRYTSPVCHLREKHAGKFSGHIFIFSSKSCAHSVFGITWSLLPVKMCFYRISFSISFCLSRWIDVSQ